MDQALVGGDSKAFCFVCVVIVSSSRPMSAAGFFLRPWMKTVVFSLPPCRGYIGINWYFPSLACLKCRCGTAAPFLSRAPASVVLSVTEFGLCFDALLAKLAACLAINKI